MPDFIELFANYRVLAFILVLYASLNNFDNTQDMIVSLTLHHAAATSTDARAVMCYRTKARWCIGVVPRLSLRIA